MARAMTWAIRATALDGREYFVRRGGLIGSGPIWTFRTNAEAVGVAEALRSRPEFRAVTVIERSHGRQFADR